MSYIYRIGAGTLSNGALALGNGYAGMGIGKNNPRYCSALPGSLGSGNFGPLPPGCYTIGEPEDDAKLGPVAMRLTPDRDNEMYGRAGFFIHGDNPAHPGESSEGCIVFSHQLRQLIANSPRPTLPDRRLIVSP